MPLAMDWSAFALLGSAFLVGCAAFDFDCDTMDPTSATTTTTTSVVQVGKSPIKLKVFPTEVIPGQKIQVILSGSEQFDSFMLICHNPIDKMPLGSWKPLNRPGRTHDCRHSNDTMTNRDRSAVEVVQASWIAPDKLNRRQRVEFKATVTTTDGATWRDIHSILLLVDESTSPVEHVASTVETQDQIKDSATSAARRAEKAASERPDEAEDLHNAEKEDEIALHWQQHKQQLLDEESSVDPAYVGLEEERRRREENFEREIEEKKYTEEKTERERKRKMMMEDELRDREQFREHELVKQRIREVERQRESSLGVRVLDSTGRIIDSTVNFLEKRTGGSSAVRLTCLLPATIFLSAAAAIAAL